MFGSIRIATIRGIPVRLNVTLLAMFVLLVVRYGAGFGLPAGLVIFGSLLFHELGHAFAGQRFGIPIAGIDLHLLGGMALLTRPPERPKHEAIIAAAGPLASLLLAGIFAGLTLLAGAWPSDPEVFRSPGLLQVLPLAAMLNVGMGLVNLLPALPMDGGRIFRAALAARLGVLDGTRIAAWVSRGFGLTFIVLGIREDAISLVVLGGLLLWMVAYEERVTRHQEQLKRRLRFDISARAAPAPVQVGPLLDGQTGEVLRETREEFVDRFGRRFVVVTRLSD